MNDAANCDPAFVWHQSDGKSAPERGHACCHGSCDWLATNSSPDLSKMELGSCLFLIPTHIARIDSVATPETWLITDFGHRCAPPLRLHLTFGVLLI
jgi:hypothetical protein